MLLFSKFLSLLYKIPATSQLVTWSSRHTVMSSHGQVVTRSSHHKPAMYKATGRGPKFSGHADINGHYQCAKFGCPRPLRGDSIVGFSGDAI